MSIAYQKQPLHDGAHPYTTFGMASEEAQAEAWKQIEEIIEPIAEIIESSDKEQRDEASKKEKGE